MWRQGVIILSTFRKIISEIQQQRSGKENEGVLWIFWTRDRGNVTGIGPAIEQLACMQNG